MSDLSAYRGRVVRSRPRRSVGPIAVVAALAASFGVGALISHFSRQEPDFFASAYALRLPDMKPAAGMSATPALHEPLVFGRCYSKLRVNCVVDGDTLEKGPLNWKRISRLPIELSDRSCQPAL